MGAGKSHLASSIGSRLSLLVVHTDDVVTPANSSRPYEELVDYERLQTQIKKAAVLRLSVVVDGICLRNILARAGVSAAKYIYVKRMTEGGLWHDGFHLSSFEGDPGSTPGEPEQSDFMYHVEQRPHECSDYFFERIE